MAEKETLTWYNLTYRVDGQVCFVEKYAKGERLSGIAQPVREHYEFSGWDALPQRMPAHDLEISGTFSPRKYLLTYLVDGEPIYSAPIPYGGEVFVPTVAEQEGRTFSGFGEIPASMPGEDLTLSGTYRPNTYQLTYMVDGKYGFTYPCDYGTVIEPLDIPVKDHHRFSGWHNLPETMPAGDLTVYGSFSLRRYVLTRYVDGKLFSQEVLPFGAKVNKKLKPMRDGYYFSGWRNLPKTMPERDVTVQASMYPVRYKVEYFLDGTLFDTVYVPYGEPFSALVPELTGRTFIGWDEVPAVMPMQDIVINGTSEPIVEPVVAAPVYTLTVVVDDETLLCKQVEAGKSFTMPFVPAKAGMLFGGFDKIPMVMPEEDVTITGHYVPKKYTLTVVVDGETLLCEQVEAGKSFTMPFVPAKAGMLFGGFDKIPMVMPEEDVTITGHYVPKKYTLTVVVDGETLLCEQVEAGKSFTMPFVPAKAGMLFGGFDKIPMVMPEEDVTITGHYVPKKYTLTVVVDGETLLCEQVEAGKSFTMPFVPEKPGKIFGGFGKIPAVMPKSDLVITGHYEPKLYNLIVTVEGVELLNTWLPAGKSITVPFVPAKPGMLFGGFDRIPMTMPAEDLTITGHYVQKKYTLSIVVDGVLLYTEQLHAGDPIGQPAVPARDGAVFAGFDMLPEVMPECDLTITGRYEPAEPEKQLYTLTLILDDQVLLRTELDAGAEIVLPGIPERIGYRLEGTEIPSVMPAEDLVLSLHYTAVAYQVVFRVDGEEVFRNTVLYGDPVTAPEVPAREGFRFSGFGTMPDAMPATDLVFDGIYIEQEEEKTAPVLYTVTFVVDGEVVARCQYAQGDAIRVPEIPEKTGYTFAGFGELPDSMPGQDLTVTGSYTPNVYCVTYRVLDTDYLKLDVAYGEAVPVPADVPVEENERLRFRAWADLPGVMPAHDVTVQAELEPRLYTVRFILDGELLYTEQLAPDAPINAPEVPERAGMRFSGWDNLEETMPCRDLMVVGSYEVLHRVLRFYADEELLAEYSVAVGAAITVQVTAPGKEGMEFDGWSGLPAVMPNEDLAVRARYCPIRYTVTFRVDGSDYAVCRVAAGENIPKPQDPEKEGYTFFGWRNFTEVMPDYDFIATAQFVQHSHVVTWFVDQEEVHSTVVAYGQPIPDFVPEEDDARNFLGWGEVPATMPDRDVDLQARFEDIFHTITFRIDGVVYQESRVKVGDRMPNPVPPARDGLVFSGWKNYATGGKMPAYDFVADGTYRRPRHTVTYLIAGEVFRTDEYPAGAVIVPPVPEHDDNAVFAGWNGLPAEMPETDLTVEAVFESEYYHLTYVLEGAPVFYKQVPFGTPLIPPQVPAKEGYSFAGWDELPATMPAHDLVISGSYEPNCHTVTFRVNGEVYHEELYRDGMRITPPEAPVISGYRFTGWRNYTSVMPPYDFIADAVYEEHMVHVSFRVEGVEVFSCDCRAGSPLEAPATEERDGYMFAGFEGFDGTAPEEDRVYTGSYRIRTYALRFVLDGEVVESYEFCAGEAVRVTPKPVQKEGYTFSGWGKLPRLMPAVNYTVYGTLTPNQYRLTFMVDNMLVFGKLWACGAPIVPPEAPMFNGMRFMNWRDLPQTMPPHDVVVYGEYAPVAPALTEVCYADRDDFSRKNKAYFADNKKIDRSQYQNLVMVGDAQIQIVIRKKQYIIETAAVIHNGKVVDKEGLGRLIAAFRRRVRIPSTPMTLIVETQSGINRVVDVPTLRHELVGDYIQMDFADADPGKKPLLTYDVLTTNKKIEMSVAMATLMDGTFVDDLVSVFDRQGIAVKPANSALMAMTSYLQMNKLPGRQTAVAAFLTETHLVTALFVRGQFAYSVQNTYPFTSESYDAAALVARECSAMMDYIRREDVRRFKITHLYLGGVNSKQFGATAKAFRKQIKHCNKLCKSRGIGNRAYYAELRFPARKRRGKVILFKAK